MDKLIQSLEELSIEISGKLEETSYEELVMFVENRQKFIDSIEKKLVSCQITPEQRQGIGQIMKYDSAILARMDSLRIDAQEWLYKRNQAKTQRNAYDSMYTPDSILMDRKK